MAKAKLILISCWLGAAVFFSFVLAPALFGTLHAFNVGNANEIAGTIVTSSLAVVNISGCVISVILFLVGLIIGKNRRELSHRLSSITLVVMAAATSIGQWVIASRMRALRASMVVIDQVPFDDPRRVAFNNLHRYSVIALTMAMCAALAAVLLTKNRDTA